MGMVIILLVMIRKYFQWHRALVFHVPAKFSKILKNKLTNVQEKFFFQQHNKFYMKPHFTSGIFENKFVSRKAAQLHVQHIAYKVHVKENDK